MGGRLRQDISRRASEELAVAVARRAQAVDVRADGVRHCPASPVRGRPATAAMEAQRMVRAAIGAVILGLVGASCGGGGDGTGNVCVPGMSVACVCTNGTQGAQVCAADGDGYGACVCSSGSGTAGTSGAGGSGAGGAAGSSGAGGGSGASGAGGGSGASGAAGTSGTTG